MTSTTNTTNYLVNSCCFFLFIKKNLCQNDCFVNVRQCMYHVKFNINLFLLLKTMSEANGLKKNYFAEMADNTD